MLLLLLLLVQLSIACVLVWGAVCWWQAARVRSALLCDTKVTVLSIDEVEQHLTANGWDTVHGVGLDVEWNHREPSITDLLQLSNGTQTLVIQLHARDTPNRCRTLPRALVDMLQDPSIHKFGVAVRQDTRRLELQYPGLIVRGDMNLSLAPSTSLKYLCSHLLHVTLPKEKHITLSDWSRTILSDEQVRYAAADAYYSWRLGQVSRMDLATVPPPLPLPPPYHPSYNHTSKDKHHHHRRHRHRYQHQQPRMECDEGRKRPLYENIPLLSQDGQLIAYINQRKQRWYIGRNIAKLVLYQEKSPAVQLLFPSRAPVDGDGHEVVAPQFEPEKNVCVVCGQGTAINCRLIRLVPPQLQRYMSMKQKAYVQRNTLGVCFDCARAWSLHSRDHIARLARDAHIVMTPPSPPSNNKLATHAAALVSDVDHNKIPPDVKEIMWTTVRTHFPKASHATLASIAYTAQHDASVALKVATEDFYRQLVTHYTSPESADTFVVEWRQLFLTSMRPRHMPTGWRADALTLRRIDQGIEI
jgi:hypothetical protein